MVEIPSDRLNKPSGGIFFDVSLLINNGFTAFEIGKRVGHQTLTLTVDAVCDHVLCDDHLITSGLTVQINDKQEIRYLANHVISGKENIPEYQYRINSRIPCQTE